MIRLRINEEDGLEHLPNEFEWFCSISPVNRSVKVHGRVITYPLA